MGMMFVATMDLSDQLCIRTTDLTTRKLDLAKTADHVATLKHALEFAKAQAIDTGEIVGKNAEMREARVRLTFAEQYDELHRAEREYYQARVQHDIAELELRETQTLIRMLGVGHE
jgi:hypothetical protein